MESRYTNNDFLNFKRICRATIKKHAMLKEKIDIEIQNEIEKFKDRTNRTESDSKFFSFIHGGINNNETLTITYAGLLIKKLERLLGDQPIMSSDQAFEAGTELLWEIHTRLQEIESAYNSIKDPWGEWDYEDSNSNEEEPLKDKSKLTPKDMLSSMVESVDSEISKKPLPEIPLSKIPLSKKPLPEIPSASNENSQADTPTPIITQYKTEVETSKADIKVNPSTTKNISTPSVHRTGDFFKTVTDKNENMGEQKEEKKEEKSKKVKK